MPTSYTHNNPYMQGGWASDSWPSDGSISPALSSHSSGSSRSSATSGEWVPAQSSYGILPIAATPGVVPAGITGSLISFRFMAHGNQMDMSVVGPGSRTCLRIRTNTTHSYAMAPSGTVAIINWTGTEPVIERGGQFATSSEFLRDMRDPQGRRLKVMVIGGREFAWAYDERAFYLHPCNSLGRILGLVQNSNGVELQVVGEGLTTEMLHSVVLAILLLQGKRFVGLA